MVVDGGLSGGGTVCKLYYHLIASLPPFNLLTFLILVFFNRCHFTVCSKVTKGMDILHKLESLPTKKEGMFVMPLKVRRSQHRHVCVLHAPPLPSQSILKLAGLLLGQLVMFYLLCQICLIV